MRILYTLSIRAHEHLNDIMLRDVARITYLRRQQVPEYDGTQITFSSQSDDSNSRREGLSHALNVLADNYDIPEWIDSRPEYVKEDHEQQYSMAILKARNLQEPVFKTKLQAKEYTRYYSLPTYRARWYTLFDEDFERAINEPDAEEWDQLSQTEKYERELHAKDKRKRYMLGLTEYSRSYYYTMAILWGMDTLHPQSRGETAYVSAALEAIGSGYLTPPEGYRELLDNTPNEKKLRFDVDVLRRGQQYGNFAHTAYIPKTYRAVPFNQPDKVTQEDIDWLINTMHLEDVAQDLVEQNSTLVIHKTKGSNSQYV